jgi:hypothetical protein
MRTKSRRKNWIVKLRSKTLHFIKTPAAALPPLPVTDRLVWGLAAGAATVVGIIMIANAVKESGGGSTGGTGETRSLKHSGGGITTTSRNAFSKSRSLISLRIVTELAQKSLEVESVD